MIDRESHPDDRDWEYEEDYESFIHDLLEDEEERRNTLEKLIEWYLT